MKTLFVPGMVFRHPQISDFIAKESLQKVTLGVLGGVMPHTVIRYVPSKMKRIKQKLPSLETFSLRMAVPHLFSRKITDPVYFGIREAVRREVPSQYEHPLFK